MKKILLILLFSFDFLFSMTFGEFQSSYYKCQYSASSNIEYRYLNAGVCKSANNNGGSFSGGQYYSNITGYQIASATISYVTASQCGQEYDGTNKTCAMCKYNLQLWQHCSPKPADYNPAPEDDKTPQPCEQYSITYNDGTGAICNGDTGFFEPTNNPQCINGTYDNGSSCTGCNGGYIDNGSGVSMCAEPFEYPYYAYPEPEPEPEEEEEEQPTNPNGGDTGSGDTGSTGGDTGSGDTGSSGSTGGTGGDTSSGDTGSSGSTGGTTGETSSGDTGSTGGSSSGGSVSGTGSSTPQRSDYNTPQETPINNTAISDPTAPPSVGNNPDGEGVDLTEIEDLLTYIHNNSHFMKQDLSQIKALGKNLDNLQYLEYMTNYAHQLLESNNYNSAVLQTMNENLRSIISGSNVGNTYLQSLDVQMSNLNNSTASNFNTLTEALNSNATTQNNTLTNGFNDLVQNINDSTTSQNEILNNGFENVVNAINNNNNTPNIDMTNTNALLSDINSSLNPDVPNPDENGVISNIEAFGNNLYGSVTTLQTNFGNLRDTLNNGFTSNISNLQNYSDCGISFTIFNKNVDFNICNSIAPIKSFFVFIFTTIFTFLAIRLFLVALKG